MENSAPPPEQDASSDPTKPFADSTANVLERTPLTSLIDGVSIVGEQPDELDGMSSDELLRELRKVVRRASADSKRAAASADRAMQADEANSTLANDSAARISAAEKRLDDVIAAADGKFATAVKKLELDISVKATASAELVEATTSNTKSKMDEVLSSSEARIAEAISRVEQSVQATVSMAESKLSGSIESAASSLQVVEERCRAATEQAQNAAASATSAQEHATALGAGLAKYFTDLTSDSCIPALQQKHLSALAKLNEEFWGADGAGGKSKTTADAIERLDQSSMKANELIETLTDVSVHGAFQKRERAADRRHTAYQLTFIVCVAAILWLGHPLVTEKLSLEALFGRSVFLLPLTYLLWVLNRTIKIEKRLAESYRHKASTMDALTGYRNLYKLQHNDPEYLRLFDKLQAEITDDPGKRIEKLLTSRLDDGSSAGLFMPSRSTKSSSEISSKNDA